MYNERSRENLTQAGKGRPPGTVNKSTKATREAFQRLLDHNEDKLIEWLKQVACGIREAGNDSVQSGEWLVKPNPAQALQLVVQFGEFCIPKLARVEAKMEHQAQITGINIRLIDPSTPEPTQLPRGLA